MRKIRVLVGCEESQEICKAFRTFGPEFEAYSCDLKPCSGGHPEWHIQGDILGVMAEPGWDLLIAHPPCRYLCSMGIWWNHKRPERWGETKKAFEFFMKFANCDIPHVAIENPIGYCGTHYRKSDQIVNPWQFGDEASKPTCLWLKDLPTLEHTKIVGKGKFYTKKNGSRMAAWSHITSGTKKELRASIAAKTFPGIAKAMATQWGKFLKEQLKGDTS